MSAWEPALITGGLAMVTAVSTAIYSQRQQRNLAEKQNGLIEAQETFKSQLAERAAKSTAKRDYENEALRRLYTQVNPLLFQLREVAQGSSNRARRILTGEIEVTDHHVYTTVQRLFSPLVVAQEVQRHLTAVDLQLDPTVRAQYSIAREMFWTLHRGRMIAKSDPAIDYMAGSSSTRTERRQHLTHAQLQRLVDCLTVVENDGVRRPMKQTELDDRAAKHDDELSRAIDPVQRLFKGAGPSETPVLWRLLLAHVLYLNAFVEIVDGDAGLFDHLHTNEDDSYRWPEATGLSFDAQLEAARTFVNHTLVGARTLHRMRVADGQGD